MTTIMQTISLVSAFDGVTNDPLSCNSLTDATTKLYQAEAWAIENAKATRSYTILIAPVAQPVPPVEQATA